ncbi:RNA ligase, DRB0094 family [Xylariaceae sp. AK1471]|nr:RNA ligase, DRB0094 family [Xylariaceae sp. AK1471]
MVRKLVTVRQIASLPPISKNVAIAHVAGWTCAVNPKYYSVGDYVLYFEIDSFLPASDARFLFLSNFITWEGVRGFHVKSKMCQRFISQGLIMSLGLFPEVTQVIDQLAASEGKDVAMEKVMAMSFESCLNVRKWEVSPAQAAQSLGPPPVFFPKTDLVRVQNAPDLFSSKYSETWFQESTKMDGAAMTIYFIRRNSRAYTSLPAGGLDLPSGRIGVCSRHHDLPQTARGPWWEIVHRYNLVHKLSMLNENIAIQGELCGSTIEGNHEGFAPGEHDFYVYTLFDINYQQFENPKDVEEKVAKLGLKHVPVHGYVKLRHIAMNQEQLLRRAEGRGIFGNEREGLVYKDCSDYRGRSFKANSNKYLLQIGQ